LAIFALFAGVKPMLFGHALQLQWEIGGAFRSRPWRPSGHSNTATMASAKINKRTHGPKLASANFRDRSQISGKLLKPRASGRHLRPYGARAFDPMRRWRPSEMRERAPCSFIPFRP